MTTEKKGIYSHIRILKLTSSRSQLYTKLRRSELVAIGSNNRANNSKTQRMRKLNPVEQNFVECWQLFSINLICIQLIKNVGPI